jgi:hypothetical protein
MQLWQYGLLVTVRPLYMFRTLLLKTVVTATGAYCVGNRPWTSLLDIYHPDP